MADVSLPTIVILVLATASLLYRRQGPVSLALARSDHRIRMPIQILGLVVGWKIIQLGSFIPVLERLTGD